MTSLRFQPSSTPDFISVTSPFDGAEVGTVVNLPPEAAPILVQTAKEGAEMSRGLPRHERARILEACAGLVEGDRDAFATLIVAESGKTLRQAQKEVLRCVNTLKLSADEARRNAGEVIPFSSYVGSENRQGWFTREPLGIIVAITPYNDPLNLVAHKLGPAIAGGNAVILKPSELAPLSAIKLVNYLTAAGMPSNVVTVATGGAALAEALVSAREVRMISFTGGFVTGEKIARSAGLKKLAMDLGGNAPVIVMPDCDLEDAIESCVSGAYWAAGQNCIGTQRILVHEDVYESFKTGFVSGTRALKVGDPSQLSTDVGPMITMRSAEKVRSIVVDALERGAKLLAGNELKGSLYSPTVLEDVSFECDLWNQEIFAPVVVLQKVTSLNEALVLANDPDYMLHAGVFTNDLQVALKAAASLDAGGVMINDSSDYRFDAMPFGGFKYGSLGREGVRFAYEDMTQPKVVCIRKVTA
ncbi:aldehyde dehydrogenase family protein [Caballeronia sp. GAFFF1]|uniref:aldehyde dehydrogenase family protein n=1 Tax=Caballeronia sp. GAFFF1 TaxID=2921779 RepID=UPI0020280B66|nr:aldehyde dehydrogenase family protein [Caballeronia sp. GAFFF1]